MGLDQYFYAEKTLSAFKKKEKLYIDYFNTLSEPDYKVQVIDLLKRVCTVSKETTAIMAEMSSESENSG